MSLLCKCSVLILTLVAISDLAGAGRGVDNIGRLDKFKLKSRIRYVYGTLLHQIDVEEYYTKSQRRARVDFVDYKTVEFEGGLQKSKSGSYIYDEAKELLIKFSDFKCEVTKLEDMDNMIEFDFLGPMEHSAENINLLNGPTKLVDLINKNRAGLVKKDESGKIIIKNNELNRFTLQLNRKVFLTLYYDLSATPKSESGIFVPKFAHISTDSEMITIDYGYLEVLDEEARKSVAGLHYETDIIIDLFSIPTEIGCSRLLQPTEIDYFADKLNSRASFQAHVAHFGVGRDYLEGKLSVAYDGNLRSLRVDMTESNTDVLTTQQVYNFKINRAYDILRRSEDTYAVVNDVLDSSGSDNMLKQQCVASQLNKLSISSSWDENSFSELITGSKFYVYMGRGVLRGIPVRIYESVKTQPPFWLEQPVLYYDENNQLHERFAQPTQMGDNFSILLSTVLFLADSDGRPLLMTVHETEGFTTTMSLRRLDIHNFVWDLSTSSIDTNRAVDLFSLTEACRGETDGAGGASHYEMLLENEGDYPPASFEVLTNNHLRNLAFLAGLQDVFLMPIIMISDVQTYLTREPKELIGPAEKDRQKQPGAFAMVASFKFAEHTTDQIVIRSIGRGEPKWIMPIRVHSFQACSMLAAHHKSFITFGYNQHLRDCYIGRPRDTEQLDDLEFEMQDDGGIINYHSTEVYSLKHKVDFIMKYLGMQGTYENSRLSIVKQTKKLFIGTDKDRATRIGFDIKRLHIHRSRQNIDLTQMDSNNATFGDIGRIDGFGFSEDSQLTKVVEPDSIRDNDNQLGFISFEACQASCLQNMACESFSVCIRGSNNECVLSGLVIRSKDAVKQLDWSLPLGKITTLELHGTSIDVKRHPNCAIYNKNSLVFFQSPSIMTVPLSKMLDIKPMKVSGIEDCAAQCVRLNLMAIKYQQDSASKDTDGRTVVRVSNWTPKICSHFEYIDASSIVGLNEEARGVALNSFGIELDEPEQSQSHGLCFWKPELINGSKSDITPAGSSPEGPALKIKLEVERYKLNPLMFYEKSDNVRLYRSNFPTQIEEIMSKVAEHSTELLFGINLEPIESLRYYIENAENNQMEYNALDELACASACFSQISGMWPVCKSFDIIFEMSDDKPSKIRCLLNSITLTEARRKGRNDLIGKQKANSKSMVWHYEPKLDLAINEIEKVDALRAYLRRTSSSIGYSFLVLAAIALGLISGMVLYREMFKKVIIRRISTSSSMNIVLDMNLDEQQTMR